MVAVNTVATANHTNVPGPVSGPQSATNTITIGASDTAVYVGVAYGASASANADGAATCTIGGVSAPAVSGSKVVGFGGTNSDGFTDWFELRNPASSPGTGSKTISVTFTFTGTTSGIGCEFIISAFTVTGTPGTTTGGHATSVNGASSITTGSQSIGSSTGLMGAVAGNGSTTPGVTTGTSQSAVTGSGNTGSDNLRMATNTGAASVTVTFSTNNADESQCSWFTVTDGGGAADPFPAGYQPAVQQQTVYRL